MCKEEIRRKSLKQTKDLANKTAKITGEIYGVYESSSGNYNYISNTTVNYNHYNIIYETS